MVYAQLHLAYSKVHIVYIRLTYYSHTIYDIIYSKHFISFSMLYDVVTMIMTYDQTYDSFFI